MIFDVTGTIWVVACCWWRKFEHAWLVYLACSPYQSFRWHLRAGRCIFGVWTIYTHFAPNFRSSRTEIACLQSIKIAFSRASWHFGHPTTPKWSYQFLFVKETDLVAFLNQPSRLHMLLTKLIDHLNPAILRARTPLILQQPASSFLSCPIATSKDARLPTKSRAQSSGWSVQLNSSFQYPKNGEQSHPEYFTLSCRQRWLRWSSTVWPRSLCSL